MKVAKTIAILLFCFSIFVLLISHSAKFVMAEDAPVIDHIILNEVCPFSDPDCKDGEWIELANLSNNDIDLTSYTIGDLNIEKDFGLTDYDSNILDKYFVKAQDFLLLKKCDGDFKFSINDTNEKIVLRKNGVIVDQLSYGTIDGVKQDYVNPIKGKSYAIESGKWRLTTTLTPGTLNVINTNSEDKNDGEVLNIDDVRDLKNGDEVTVTGIVTVLPGVLSTQYFYIQDESGGIQIYCHNKTFPVLILGDSISVTGELSESYSDRRIITNSDQIVIPNHTNTPNHLNPIIPAPIAIPDIGEDDEGELVTTSGIVTETSGDTFVISDGGKEIKVVIRQTTGIDKPKMKKGDEVVVTGIVSQYKNEYRILPIDQDDVKIVASETELPRSGNEELIYLFISLFLTVLWNIYLKAKRKLLPSQTRLLPLQNREM